MDNIPRFLYKIDLQKLSGGEYEHTVLTNRWLSRNTDTDTYNKLHILFPTVFDDIFIDDSDNICFRTLDLAKQFIKIISCLIYHKVTYIKILKMDNINKTKTIGFAINVSTYKEYGFYKITENESTID